MGGTIPFINADGAKQLGLRFGLAIEVHINDGKVGVRGRIAGRKNNRFLRMP